MKLQKLTIHNIASIEDATIDFEAQPLAGSEVFLITGKTGAGKSTILDAICLALFANTPRLVGTQMQGNTLDGEKQITGYEYEVEAAFDALEEGWKECPDMPHALTLKIMNTMDFIRKQTEVKFPGEE